MWEIFSARKNPGVDPYTAAVDRHTAGWCHRRRQGFQALQQQLWIAELQPKNM